MKKLFIGAIFAIVLSFAGSASASTSSPISAFLRFARSGARAGKATPKVVRGASVVGKTSSTGFAAVLATSRARFPMVGTRPAVMLLVDEGGSSFLVREGAEATRMSASRIRAELEPISSPKGEIDIFVDASSARLLARVESPGSRAFFVDAAGETHTISRVHGDDGQVRRMVEDAGDSVDLLDLAEPAHDDSDRDWSSSAVGFLIFMGLLGFVVAVDWTRRRPNNA